MWQLCPRYIDINIDTVSLIFDPLFWIPYITCSINLVLYGFHRVSRVHYDCTMRGLLVHTWNWNLMANGVPTLGMVLLFSIKFDALWLNILYTSCYHLQDLINGLGSNEVHRINAIKFLAFLLCKIQLWKSKYPNPHGWLVCSLADSGFF